MKYHACLSEGPEMTLKVCPSLNPAIYFPDGENIEHVCQEVLLELSSRHDLKDESIETSILPLFADGSSSIQKRINKAGSDFWTRILVS